MTDVLQPPSKLHISSLELQQAFPETTMRQPSPIIIVQSYGGTPNGSTKTLVPEVTEIKQTQDLSKEQPIEYPRPAILYQRSNDSLASSNSTLMPEKETRVCELPLKRHSRIWRNLRYTFFSVYRRLFTLIFLVNAAVFVWLMIKHKSLFKIAPSTLSTATSSNLFMSIFMRQELTINLLFTVFGWCPTWMPLRIRRLFAKIYHFGGIHSGCGVAATVWFTIFQIVQAYNAAVSTSTVPEQAAALALTAVIDGLLLSIVVFSHPRLRALFHDWFEAIHRFGGWTAVLLFWAQLVVLTDFERRQMWPVPSLRSMLIVNPSFWLLIAVTICIISPWLQLRKVDVHPEFLSDHAIRLHFTYTNLALCCAPRFTDRPLRDWHAFAGIPVRNAKGFSVVVSNAGDWTKKIIRDPPTHLWTRGFPTKGVMNIAQIFKSVVLVCTGSGIGPILSLVTARNIQCRIVWSTPTPEKTFSQGIISDVYQADPQALIIDTKRFGRPDLVKVSYEVFAESGAEAVFIISNPPVTRKVVYGLETRGVPIFAPIFDS